MQINFGIEWRIYQDSALEGVFSQDENCRFAVSRQPAVITRLSGSLWLKCGCVFSLITPKLERKQPNLKGLFGEPDERAGDYHKPGTSRSSEVEPQCSRGAHLDLKVTISPSICRIAGRCHDIVPSLGIERPKDL